MIKTKEYNVGIIGIGFVGNAILSFFENQSKINLKIYDKYKNDFSSKYENTFKSVLNTDFLFLCLPTPYNEESGYDLTFIRNCFEELKSFNYKGIILLKSTVLPGTCAKLQSEFGLRIVHNPEFLSSKTAVKDFKEQEHIVLGSSNKEDLILVKNFYRSYFSDIKYSLCSYEESESMKIFCNSFYAVKIQFFNELFLLCQHMGIDFDKVRDLMLKNNWINPMHTKVPGPDGLLSYGNVCFPKDTSALLCQMKSLNSSSDILEACVNERNRMRNYDEKI